MIIPKLIKNAQIISISKRRSPVKWQDDDDWRHEILRKRHWGIRKMEKFDAHEVTDIDNGCNTERVYGKAEIRKNFS